MDIESPSLSHASCKGRSDERPAPMDAAMEPQTPHFPGKKASRRLMHTGHAKSTTAVYTANSTIAVFKDHGGPLPWLAAHAGLGCPEGELFFSQWQGERGVPGRGCDLPVDPWLQAMVQPPHAASPKPRAHRRFRYGSAVSEYHCRGIHGRSSTRLWC